MKPGGRAGETDVPVTKITTFTNMSIDRRSWRSALVLFFVVARLAYVGFLFHWVIPRRAVEQVVEESLAVESPLERLADSVSTLPSDHEQRLRQNQFPNHV